MKHKTRQEVLNEFPKYQAKQISRFEVALVSASMAFFATVAFIFSSLI